MKVNKNLGPVEKNSTPKGWELKHLGDLGYFLKGKGISKANAQSGNLPCVRYGEIYTKHNSFIKIFYSSISPRVAESAELLRRGDILFAGSGETKNEIGKCVAFLGNNKVYAGGDIVILRQTKNDPMFLGFYLNTKSIAIQKTSRGQGDAIVHISTTALSDIVITLPPLSEQVAIAKILADFEMLIQNLEKLIAKKQAIKQGMMQQLLTGKTRLPGFTGKWQTIKLLDMGKIITGRTPSIDNPHHFSTTGYPFITPTDINEDGLLRSQVRHISRDGMMAHKSLLLPKNSIAVTCIASIGKTYLTTEESLTNQQINSIIPDSNRFDPLFIYYLVQQMIPKMMTIAGTSVVPIINRATFCQLDATVPIRMEQMAIATIILDADKEIMVLKLKLNKIRQIKQGMLELLLTGKIRLIKPEDNDD